MTTGNTMSDDMKGLIENLREFETEMREASEQAQAEMKMGRRAIGIELKPGYFALATRNMNRAEETQYEMAI